MSIFDVIAQQESSGGRNLYNPTPTSSGHAEGWYGITTGTWQDFAPKAGVDLAQYPDPNSAPQFIQQQVAGQIPLSRWAPSTVSAVHAAYPGVADDSQTVGTLNAGNYGDLGPATAGAGNTGPAAPGSDLGPATAGGSLAGALINPVWEIVSRGLLIWCGFALVFIALVALLFQSKTVRTTVKGAAAAAAL